MLKYRTWLNGAMLGAWTGMGSGVSYWMIGARIARKVSPERIRINDDRCSWLRLLTVSRGASAIRRRLLEPLLLNHPRALCG